MIEERWGTSINPPKKEVKFEDEGDPDDDSCFEFYEDDAESIQEAPETEDTVDSMGKLINQQPVSDVLLNAEIIMNLEDGQSKLAKSLDGLRTNMETLSVSMMTTQCWIPSCMR